MRSRGRLGADEQAMLLRAVEEKRFLPLGSDRERSSDFQLIAGTNRDLAARRRGEPAPICSRGSASGRSRCPPSPTAARGHRAEPRLRIGALRPALRRAGDIQQGEPRPISEIRPHRAVARQLPRPQRGGHPGSERWRKAVASPRRASITEIARLAQAWAKPAESAAGTELDLEAWLGVEVAAAIDPFDRHQLGYVIRVCRESHAGGCRAAAL
ncbi:MAG: sigma 54-interacting transcriptional regulator [Verrucomicrobiales bacterium]